MPAHRDSTFWPASRGRQRTRATRARKPRVKCRMTEEACAPSGDCCIIATSRSATKTPQPCRGWCDNIATCQVPPTRRPAGRTAVAATRERRFDGMCNKGDDPHQRMPYLNDDKRNSRLLGEWKHPRPPAWKDRWKKRVADSLAAEIHQHLPLSLHTAFLSPRIRGHARNIFGCNRPRPAVRPKPVPSSRSLAPRRAVVPGNQVIPLVSFLSHNDSWPEAHPLAQEKEKRGPRTPPRQARRVGTPHNAHCEQVPIIFRFRHQLSNRSKRSLLSK